MKLISLFVFLFFSTARAAEEKALPVCASATLEEKFTTCQPYSCQQEVEAAGVKKKRTVSIDNSSIIRKTCRFNTSEKIYKVPSLRWADFSKIITDVISENPEDNFKLQQEVAKTGRIEKMVSFVVTGNVNCEYNLTYEFVLNKTNTVITYEAAAANDGLLVRKNSNEDVNYYIENGITYKKEDKTKPVFFYAQVKMVQPSLDNNSKACTGIPGLYPYFLDQLNQVEHLPPDKTI